MAYLAAQDAFDTATATPATLYRAVERTFARAEWDVIALARNDGLASLREPSGLTRLLNRLFGLEGTRPLANPKLEALRRVAVLAWEYGYQLPVSALKALKAEGYTAEQVELLLASVSTERSGGRRGARA